LYFGLSVRSQPLLVSFLTVELATNSFASCAVSVSPKYGGNAYGGAVSLYIGGYSSAFESNRSAAADVGATDARNLSVTLNDAVFTACHAKRSSSLKTEFFGASVYGGSFSFYIGAYAWSRSISQSSSSKVAATAVSSVRVIVSNAVSSNCSAFVTTSNSQAYDVTAFGGSMSVLYIGAYASSYSPSSSSASESTSVSDVIVSVSNASCSNCSVSTELTAYSSKSCGGFMSVLHIGSSAWSMSKAIFSSSKCDATNVSLVNMNIRFVSCSNCYAFHISTSTSRGVSTYGGSMSVLQIGSYTWSDASPDNAPPDSQNSVSRSATTYVSDVIVSVNKASCFNCSSRTETGRSLFGGKSYGGFMNVLHIGTYAWSHSQTINSSSTVAPSNVVDVFVSVSNAFCSNCTSITNSKVAYCANSYGGSMNVFHIGAFAWSYSEKNQITSSSTSGTSTTFGVIVSVSNSSCSSCIANVSTVESYGVKSYGGSMSILHIGALAWSYSESSNSNSSSVSEATNVSDVIVSVSNASCSKCTAQVATGLNSYGASSYGGSVNVVHIGALAWSALQSSNSNSSSVSEATNVSDVIVSVSNASCSRCTAQVATGLNSYGASSYGGSMSVLHTGAFAYCASNSSSSNIISKCEATVVTNVTVRFINASCFNCSAVTHSNQSVSEMSYGGSISAVRYGAYAFSYANGGGGIQVVSYSSYTLVIELSVIMDASVFDQSLASIQTQYYASIKNSNVAEDSNVCCCCFVLAAALFSLHSLYSTLTCSSQVHGGTVSVLIGSRAHSETGAGSSRASSEYTNCSNCQFSMVNVSITSSDAVSYANGNLFHAAFLFMIMCCVLQSVIFFWLWLFSLKHTLIAD
jgi:hypothetical protein